MGPRTAERGLCGRCLHAREVKNRRGSGFVLCGLSRTDSAFPRYPRLPVLRCAGFRDARVTEEGARDHPARLAPGVRLDR